MVNECGRVWMANWVTRGHYLRNYLPLEYKDGAGWGGS